MYLRAEVRQRTQCKSSHSGNSFRSWRIAATSPQPAAASQAEWPSDILAEDGRRCSWPWAKQPSLASPLPIVAKDIFMSAGHGRPRKTNLAAGRPLAGNGITLSGRWTPSILSAGLRRTTCCRELESKQESSAAAAYGDRYHASMQLQPALCSWIDAAAEQRSSSRHAAPVSLTVSGALARSFAAGKWHLGAQTSTSHRVDHQAEARAAWDSTCA
jgi:hypothetical protein